MRRISYTKPSAARLPRTLSGLHLPCLYLPRTLHLLPSLRALRLSTLLLLLPLLPLLPACGHASELDWDDPADENSHETIAHPSQVSIAYLRSLAVGESVTIDKPYSVSGLVTATDAYGEYFMCICIEDSTGGLELLIEGYALYRRFALYDRVRVECHGLAVGRYGSRIQLGAPPSGEYVVDRIAESDIGRYISEESAAAEPFEPVTASIAELRPEYVGRTVMVEGLHSADAGTGWCATEPQTGRFADTERIVADDWGRELTVCLRGGCRYAAEPIPDGRFALCGILEYRSGAFALRITNRGIIGN